MIGHPPTFSTKLVRDLAWVIASPPIQSGHIENTYWWDHDKCQNEFQDCLPTLLELDKDPSPLEQHLSQAKSKRLGHRFETLVSYWLSISPNYELIQQNIQIIEDGITYGEIDFIIKEISTGKVIHLEVCVKFYLGTEPYKNPYRWFGTNTKDQLGKKLDHLLTHQSQLSNNHEGYFSHKIDVLKNQQIDERHCFIKGRLFYPEGSKISPEDTTDNHLRGSWIYSNTIQNTDKKYLAINKTLWLSELNYKDIIDLQKNPVEVFKDRAQCYVEIGLDDHDNLKEQRRVFLLPEAFTFPSDNKNPL
ncbi:DUF1853 family protein [Cocleimonas flava]|uniref:DUF1853 family protein n=1 Tax=Cocleimonas flava TaxID=634765 RepID=A0A4V2P8C7_9GAMM|nr:DUF1853 family protein [Cocleimonas flava]TCJ85255.1 hypothetical protein EV695_3222 [Cocleimonas flava]